MEKYAILERLLRDELHVPLERFHPAEEVSDEDLARVRGVREVIGPNRDLMIDANCGWDADTAIQAIHDMDDLNVGLTEQPTPDGDYAALARVRREDFGHVAERDHRCGDIGPEPGYGHSQISPIRRHWRCPGRRLLAGRSQGSRSDFLEFTRLTY